MTIDPRGDNEEETYRELRKTLNFAARLASRLEPRVDTYQQMNLEMKMVQKAMKKAKISAQIMKTIDAMLNGKLVHRIHFMGSLPFDSHKIVFAHLLGIALELKDFYACTLNVPLSFLTKVEQHWLAKKTDVKVTRFNETFFQHANLGVELIFAADLERFEYLDYILWKNRNTKMSDIILITNDFSNSLTAFDEADLPGLTSFVSNSTLAPMPHYQPFEEYRLSRLNWDHQPVNAFSKLAIMHCNVSTFPEIAWEEKALKATEDTLLHEARADALWKVHRLQNSNRLEEKSEEEINELIGALPLNLGNNARFF
ncbi:unnamed protein product, partial [Mesorhabditis belari]|uniref:SRR1-like domain-containing protein n=1 Tax=Mesorhabditis belari TaxID=2138241 RepID=A0AAF3EER2_9BILA